MKKFLFAALLTLAPVNAYAWDSNDICTVMAMHYCNECGFQSDACALLAIINLATNAEDKMGKGNVTDAREMCENVDKGFRKSEMSMEVQCATLGKLKSKIGK